jgi:hypothetical protein
VPAGPGLLLPRVARQLDPDPELVPEDAGQDPHLSHHHLVEPAGAEGLPGLPGSCRPMVGACNRLCARLWDDNLLVGGPFGQPAASTRRKSSRAHRRGPRCILEALEVYPGGGSPRGLTHSIFDTNPKTRTVLESQGGRLNDEPGFRVEGKSDIASREPPRSHSCSQALPSHAPCPEGPQGAEDRGRGPCLGGARQ